MKFLYPCDPLNSRQVDPDYKKEHDIVESVGGQIALFDFDRFKENDLNIIARINGHRILYRGWMMTAEEYERFNELVTNCGGTLITTPSQYLRTHHLPYWYELCGDKTAKTIILGGRDDMAKVLDKWEYNFGPSLDSPDYETSGYTSPEKFFIKDYVKSNNGPHGSVVSNQEELNNVISDFETFRGGFEGGMCVRKYTEYEEDSEVRIFVYGGYAHYDDDAIQFLPDFVFDVIKQIESPFFTIDIAKKKSNSRWEIVEIGDGQVSSIKNISEPYLDVLFDEIILCEYNAEEELKILQSTGAIYQNHDWSNHDDNIKLYNDLPELYVAHHIALGNNPTVELSIDKKYSSGGIFDETTQGGSVASLFMTILDTIEQVIFEHQEDFINTFMPGCEVDEITKVSISSEHCHFTGIQHSGMHMAYTIDIRDFAEWLVVKEKELHEKE